MTNYQIIGYSPTASGNLKLNGILASAMLFTMQPASLQAESITSHIDNRLNPVSCNIDIVQLGAVSTSWSNDHILDRDQNGVPSDFESTISNFFIELSSMQEPLDTEFKQVLEDNLWDLYQS